MVFRSMLCVRYLMLFVFEHRCERHFVLGASNVSEHRAICCFLLRVGGLLRAPNVSEHLARILFLVAGGMRPPCEVRRRLQPPPPALAPGRPSLT